jgi:hypothetical protein
MCFHFRSIRFLFLFLFLSSFFFPHDLFFPEFFLYPAESMNRGNQKRLRNGNVHTAARPDSVTKRNMSRRITTSLRKIQALAREIQSGRLSLGLHHVCIGIVAYDGRRGRYEDPTMFNCPKRTPEDAEVATMFDTARHNLQELMLTSSKRVCDVQVQTDEQHVHQQCDSDSTAGYYSRTDVDDVLKLCHGLGCYFVGKHSPDCLTLSFSTHELTQLTQFGRCRVVEGSLDERSTLKAVIQFPYLEPLDLLYEPVIPCAMCSDLECAFHTDLDINLCRYMNKMNKPS